MPVLRDAFGYAWAAYMLIVRTSLPIHTRTLQHDDDCE